MGTTNNNFVRMALQSHVALGKQLYDESELYMMSLEEECERLHMTNRWLASLVWMAYRIRMYIAVSIVEETARQGLLSLEAIYRRHRIDEILLIQLRYIRQRMTREESAAMRKIAVVEFCEREHVYRQALLSSGLAMITLFSDACSIRIATIRQAESERPEPLSEFYGGVVIHSAFEKVLKPELIHREAIIRHFDLMDRMQNIELWEIYLAFCRRSEMICRNSDVYAFEAKWRSWLEFAQKGQLSLYPFMPWNMRTFRCVSLLDKKSSNRSPSRQKKREPADICQYVKRFFSQFLLMPVKEACFRELLVQDESQQLFGELNRSHDGFDILPMHQSSKPIASNVSSLHMKTSLFRYSSVAERFRHKILAERPAAKQCTVRDAMSHLLTHEMFQRYRNERLSQQMFVNVVFPMAAELLHKMLLAAETPFQKMARHYDRHDNNLNSSGLETEESLEPFFQPHSMIRNIETR